MFEEKFRSRLTELREKRGFSARDMSLSIGQNPGYIHNIESGKALPSMVAFFYICDYLRISPRDFFDFDCSDPIMFNSISEDLKGLNSGQLANIAAIVKDLRKGNGFQ